MAAVAQLLSLIIGVVVVPVTAILLIVTATWEGRGFAVGVLSAAVAMFVASFGHFATRRRRMRIAAGYGIISFGLVFVIAWRAPSGTSPSAASELREGVTLRIASSDASPRVGRKRDQGY